MEGPARDDGQPPRVETVYAVTAADIEVGTNRAKLRAFGEVIAGTSAELRVASPGEVIAVADDLAVGRVVEKGATLVTIDPFAYEGALREARAQHSEAIAGEREAAARIALEESGVERAAEQLDLARRDLERAVTLTRSGNITDRGVDDRRLLVSQRRQALDQRRYTLDVEKARRDQMLATIARLDWAVERAERALEDTALVAPFTGIVRAENAAVGRLLAANDVAVELIRADALDVRFTLSDQRYGRLMAGSSLIGTPVAVTWRIGDVPISYEATISRVAADIDSATGGVDVFARLTLPASGVAPRPGAFVEVRVPGLAHPGTARIPAAALYGDHVFLIADDSRLVRRDVSPLALDGGTIIVKGPLTSGDVVVTTRLAEAGEGIKVRRVVLDAPDVAAAPAAPEAPAVTPAGASEPVRRRRKSAERS
nr:efflux RND transporter periplasmic adaptor subunit [Acuticoccus mangrovi]